MNTSMDSQNGYWRTYWSGYSVLGLIPLAFCSYVVCCTCRHAISFYCFHATSTSSFVFCAKISLESKLKDRSTIVIRVISKRWEKIALSQRPSMICTIWEVFFKKSTVYGIIKWDQASTLLVSKSLLTWHGSSLRIGMDLRGTLHYGSTVYCERKTMFLLWKSTPFGWNYKPVEKYCWLIFCERKILFRLKKQAE
jgi:hypothetical protein